MDRYLLTFQLVVHLCCWDHHNYEILSCKNCLHLHWYFYFYLFFCGHSVISTAKRPQETLKFLNMLAKPINLMPFPLHLRTLDTNTTAFTLLQITQKMQKERNATPQEGKMYNLQYLNNEIKPVLHLQLHFLKASLIHVKIPSRNLLVYSVNYATTVLLEQLVLHSWLYNVQTLMQFFLMIFEDDCMSTCLCWHLFDLSFFC